MASRAWPPIPCLVTDWRRDAGDNSTPLSPGAKTFVGATVEMTAKTVGDVFFWNWRWSLLFFATPSGLFSLGRVEPAGAVYPPTLAAWAIKGDVQIRRTDERETPSTTVTADLHLFEIYSSELWPDIGFTRWACVECVECVKCVECHQYVDCAEQCQHH